MKKDIKITYSFSQWNGLMTKKPYNRKPLKREVVEANKNKRIITKDGLYIFGWETGCEVRAVNRNSLAINRYSDVYSII